MKDELDLSKYAKKKKTDLKNPSRTDTSSFAKMVDLAILKPDVDKLDID